MQKMFNKEDMNGAAFSTSKIYMVILALIVAGVTMAGCSKRQIIVPKVTENPSDLRLTGKFVWYDLFTHDLPAAGRFYHELFGWSFENTDSGVDNVKTIIKNRIPIGNAVHIDPLEDKVTASRWLSYMSVQDVDAATVIVEQNKGSMYMQPKDLPHRGRVAVVFDSEGAIFGIVTTLEGDPPDRDYVENIWISSELWTTDLDSALRFYGSLVGYEQQLVNVGMDTAYHLLVKDGTPRAGMVKIPWDDVKPNWIPYIAVADAEAMAENAVRAGGKLLVEPDPNVREGRLAIIADPSGAVFAIQELLETASGGERQP